MLCGVSGKKILAWLERFVEVENVGARAICSTTSGYYLAMHANSFTVAVSGSCQEGQNV